MRNQTHTVDMTKGSIYPYILKFAFPLMLTGVLQTLYNAADMIVVGRFVSEKALAAVGSTSSAINLMINLFMGLSSAASVVVARKFGAKNESGVHKVVHTAIATAITGGILLSIIGILISRKVLILMDSPKDVIDLSALYMKIYFAGFPALLLYNFGAAILRAIGDTKRPLFFLLFSGTINVILNLIFVIVFKMSVVGVALATIISQIISAALVIKCLIKTEECYGLIVSKIKFYKSEFTEILYLGIPATIQGTTFSVSNMIIQSSINSAGSIAMAGNAASANIEVIVHIAMNAFYHAIITFVGQNYGAGKFRRIDKGVLAGCISVIFTGAIIGGLISILAYFAVGIYSDVKEVISVGVVRLRYMCSTYFICGLMDAMTAALRGIGASMTPMIITLAGVYGVRIVTVLICGPYNMAEDLIPLYLSYPISWIITFAMLITAFVLIKRKKQEEFEGKK